MAAGKKQKTYDHYHNRKLLPNTKVEVRSLEEGSLGSWNSATVISADILTRKVRYDSLFLDDCSDYFIECVDVSAIVDGGNSIGHTLSDYRGRIRPLPPSFETNQWSLKWLNYGQCVDMHANGAWWEGVIFDHENGSQERRIFFPDLGEERISDIESLRITQDWDEVYERWQPRGNWLFLEFIEEIEKHCPLSISVKQIWYDIRVKGSGNLKEWTSADRDHWKKWVAQVWSDNLKISVNCNSGVLVQEGPVSLELSERDISSTDKQLSEVNCKRNCDGFPTKFGKRMWLPVPSDMLPEPDLNLDAVFTYCENSSKVIKSLIPKVKGHMLSLGWKFEFSKAIPADRLRYISPEGSLYYSLREACRMLKSKSEVRLPKPEVVLSMPLSSDRDKQSLLQVTSTTPRCTPMFLYQENNQQCFSQITGSDTRSPSLPDGSITTPEREVKKSNFQYSKYDLQAVTDYINSIKVAGRTKELVVKAKEHLVADGWNLNYVFKKSKSGEGKREMRYYSPDGKSFYSLITACVWFMKNIGKVSDSVNPLEERRVEDTRDGLKGQLSDFQLSDKIILPKHSSNQSKVKDFGFRKEKKRKNAETGFTFQTKHRKVESLVLDHEQKSGFPIQLANDTFTHCTTGMPRSSKRIRLGVSPSNHTPQNLLSLLIENNVVLTREKVHCRGIDGGTVAEGRITCYGIECCCCGCMFSMSEFVVHAGNNCGRPAANIFLKDGKSMLDCQSQLMQDKKSKSLRIKDRKIKVNGNSRKNDDICSICHYGGDIILCDQCPSSFHIACLGLESVPEGDWFCPSCCCGICGKSHRNPEHVTNSTGCICSQCERPYHVGCLQAKGLVHTGSNLVGRWFCTMQCEKGLHQYLGRPVTVGNDGLTWTLAKYTEAEDRNHVGGSHESSIETYNKLTVALGVMHECFEPVKETLTNRDIVEDVIFSKRSSLNRLNFHGFYTVLLEKNDELITAATIRVYGKKVAEVPLIATRFQYRRQGMCRILMDELEKMLVQLGVERLVLPAAPSVLDTWITSFGFSKMNKSEQLNFLDYTFLEFQGTVRCQKVLKGIHSSSLNHVEGPKNQAFSDEDEDEDVDID